MYADLISDAYKSHVLVWRYQETPEVDSDFKLKSKFNLLKPPPRATASTSQAVNIMSVISGRWRKRPWKTSVLHPWHLNNILPLRWSGMSGWTVRRPVQSHERSDQGGGMEHRARLHPRHHCAGQHRPHLQTTAERRQSNLHGKTHYVLKQLWPSFLSKVRFHICFSVFADAFSSVFTFAEYIYQCLPDGPVRPRHVDQIRYLDGSG